MRTHARVAVALLPLLVACSISTSPSDIASSFSDSSTSSSGDRHSGYQAEVRDYTDAYVRSSADVSGFWSGLAKIASRRGVGNWEAEKSTWTGIGQGLRKARVTPEQLQVYKTNFAEGDADKASGIQRGYDQGS